MVVEAEVEIDALHLAVADEVGAGAELIVEGEAHGVAYGLVAVVGAEQLRLSPHVVAELGVPAGERPTADDGGRDQGERRHAGSL